MQNTKPQITYFVFFFRIQTKILAVYVHDTQTANAKHMIFLSWGSRYNIVMSSSSLHDGVVIMYMCAHTVAIATWS